MTIIDQADLIISLSHELDTLESAMTYHAGKIADAAVSDQTDTATFASMIAQYREARDEHAEVKVAYRALLDQPVGGGS